MTTVAVTVLALAMCALLPGAQAQYGGWPTPPPPPTAWRPPPPPPYLSDTAATKPLLSDTATAGAVPIRAPPTAGPGGTAAPPLQSPLQTGSGALPSATARPPPAVSPPRLHVPATHAGLTPPAVPAVAPPLPRNLQTGSGTLPAAAAWHTWMSVPSGLHVLSTTATGTGASGPAAVHHRRGVCPAEHRGHRCVLHTQQPVHVRPAVGVLGAVCRDAAARPAQLRSAGRLPQGRSAPPRQAIHRPCGGHVP